jgi:hypothetical protein
VLFGALAVVLVTGTTALVGREWHIPRDEGPERPRHWNPLGDINFFAPRTDDEAEEKEEQNMAHDEENLNVLHLLYTIAQVLFKILR